MGALRANEKPGLGQAARGQIRSGCCQIGVCRTVFTYGLAPRHRLGFAQHWLRRPRLLNAQPRPGRSGTWVSFANLGDRAVPPLTEPQAKRAASGRTDQRRDRTSRVNTPGVLADRSDLLHFIALWSALRCAWSNLRSPTQRRVTTTANSWRPLNVKYRGRCRPLVLSRSSHQPAPGIRFQPGSN